MMQIRQNVKSAFTEGANRAFIVLSAFVLFATRDLTVLFVALAIECGYMLFVPPSAWYRGILQGRALQERQRQRARLKAQILPRLLPVDRSRFLRLETLRNQIPTASSAHPQEMVGICSQMDVLLDKFMQFAAKNAQYRAYLVEMVRPTPGPAQTGAPWLDKLFDLASTVLSEKQDGVRIPAGPSGKRVTDIAAIVEEVRKGIDSRIEKLRANAAIQTNDANRQVMVKNLEVLTKRRERLGELGDIITNLEYQLELIESTFGLISDQMRTLAPEQVLKDINEVVIQTETTAQLLAATAPMEAALSRVDRMVA